MLTRAVQPQHILLACLLTLSLLSPRSASAQAASASAASASAKIVFAAEAFLATLSEAERSKAVFAFDDEKQKARWSNLPTGIFHREGARLGDLTKPQRDAAMALMGAALSKRGYQKVTEIIAAEETLNTGGRPGRLMFGRDEFYIAFLGKPSATTPWRLQFGGHHLALNLTFVHNDTALTPSHTAAQPARFTMEGKTVRPLGQENDKAFALIHALTEAQQKVAILAYQMRDLALPPGQDGKMIQPEGIQASTLTAPQQEMLLDLASEWTGIVHDAAASAKWAEIKKTLAETWFAWSGPTENGSAAYFRIQGPTVFIEYAPQKMGGDATMHIHTMYRDPSNEYGKKWLK